MTTKEAIQAMLDGKKVRDSEWIKGQYLYFNGTEFRCENNRVYTSFHMGHGDWEIYEEPKKQTVTIEKWLCKSAWDNYFIIEGEVAFFKTGGYDKQQVKLLDTYEVEI